MLNGGLQPQEEFLGMKVHGLDRATLLMFDRLIVATAIVHGATLITMDQRMTRSELVTTIW